MSYYIITAMVALAAAKAKAQAKDNLFNLEREGKSDGKRGGANERVNPVKKDLTSLAKG